MEGRNVNNEATWRKNMEDANLTESYLLTNDGRTVVGIQLVFSENDYSEVITYYLEGWKNAIEDGDNVIVVSVADFARLLEIAREYGID